MALDHIGLSVTDYDAALGFYQTILAPLGNKRIMSVESEHGRGTGFGKHGPSFWIHGPPSGKTSSKSSMPMHVAFAASSRKDVDRFYDAAIAAGGIDNGKPGLREYHPFYYAAYVKDMDGNNIEAVNHFEWSSWKVWAPITMMIAVFAHFYMKH
ncbi:hypothetical protein GUITHDRAFT_109077 [Guillardia theta CCMP2712]|uniref:VOC domain-containing protein n=1 Tax=Guillardia theta (strain CCMP2712) TaxID=905079 RepID=L1J9M4_GUITC|nr:hypothetical protein GUITHDRAFT_109077 [Guillardia theta CCMP2712]EKX45032.1 hypothetical protein GUITHDRAFT_109077 [Guillardia theta CCMP2712]|mmetsp:Transcript_49498/g.155133  ORF Transcript_49498/g.155133 Transcript_49498/m.155133 type:complete len:154 (-) Transcript_49498:528-989(-)|eukprot:XP_005832012.1 hypothetical protein GUITHDRAFT_109077 [Guillardia theta CCMP2712]